MLNVPELHIKMVKMVHFIPNHYKNRVKATLAAGEKQLEGGSWTSEEDCTTQRKGEMRAHMG